MKSERKAMPKLLPCAEHGIKPDIWHVTFTIFPHFRYGCEKCGSLGTASTMREAIENWNAAQEAKKK